MNGPVSIFNLLLLLQLRISFQPLMLHHELGEILVDILYYQGDSWNIEENLLLINCLVLLITICYKHCQNWRAHQFAIILKCHVPVLQALNKFL